MVVNVKAHYDGKVLVLDEPAELPINTPLMMTVDLPIDAKAPSEKKKKRVFGQLKDKIRAAHDFDEPLPEEYWKVFK